MGRTRIWAQSTDAGWSAGVHCLLSLRWLRYLMLTVSLVVLVVPATASAAHTARTTSRAHPRVLARRFVRANDGAWVKARGGRGIVVPPGTMARSGWVSISEVNPGVYDFHISVPWQGTVAISLPLKRRTADTIIHDIGGIWLPEGPHRGLRTVWVSQLSWFSSTLAGVGHKVAGKLCLVWNRSAFLKCLVEKGVGYVDGKLADWIISKLPKGCAAHMIEGGLLRGGGENASGAQFSQP
jgi:hypothetical protein